jgi:hypothetical protein
MEDEISIKVELVSLGNREICIDPRLEQNKTISQDEKTTMDVASSTSTSLVPGISIDMPRRPKNFSREK